MDRLSLVFCVSRRFTNVPATANDNFVCLYFFGELNRRRFPSFLRLKDYSPTDLGRIAEQAARRRFGATFDDGVEAQLVAEIAGKHLASIAKHNASLSIRMVEAALTAMAERVMSEQESDAIDRNMNNDMTMMMANDEVSEKQLTTLKFVDFTSSQFASDL